MAMAQCEVCGNEYDKAFQVSMPTGDSHTFDSFEGMYRALEAVESVRVSSGHTYLKGLIVLISTDLALGHSHLLSGSRQSPFLEWIPWVRLGQTPAKSKGRCRKMSCMPTIRVFQS